MKDSIYIAPQFNYKVEKCEYCGANMKADCHAHASWCPNYCKDEKPPKPDNPSVGNLAVGDGLTVLWFLGLIYTLFIFKRPNK